MAIKTPINTDMIARVANMTRQETGWFSPLKPVTPVVPKEQQDSVIGRMFDYPTGYNVRMQPRAGENIGFAEMVALADAYDMLRLVIETRKDQLGGLKWSFAMREDGKDPDARVKQLTEFFQYPDKEHDWDTWLRALVEDLLVIDAPTLYPRKTRGGGLYALEVMDGATIKRVIDDTGRTPAAPDAAYQQIIKGLPVMNYSRDELIYRPRNFRSRRVYGYSPVEQIIVTVNIALRRQAHQLQYYTEGNVPEALIGVPETWTPEQIKQFQQFWDALIEGDTAQRRHAKFVPGDMKYQPTREAVLKDMYDEWLARVVCFAFSLSPNAFVNQMNRATAETAQETAQAEGLAPLMLWVKSTIDYIVSKYFGFADIEFQWVNQEEIDPEARARVHAVYIENKVMTPDEVRVDLGKKPLTDEEKAKAFPEPPPIPGGGDNTGGNPDNNPDNKAKASAKEALAKAGKPQLAAINRERAVVAEATKRIAGHIERALKDIAGKALDSVGVTVKSGVEPALLAMLGKINSQGWLAITGVMADELAKVASDGGLEAIIQLGIEDDVDAMLDLVNERAVKWAKSHAAELVGMKWVDDELVPNPDAKWRIDEATRDGLAKLVTQAEAEGWSNDALAKAISESYSFSAERAMLIARTETANADVWGNMAAYEASGVVDRKRWLVAQSDFCPVCAGNGDDGEIGFDAPFTSGVFHPPAHPNCRCDVVPVLAETSKIEKYNPNRDKKSGRFAHGHGGKGGSGGGGGDSGGETESAGAGGSAGDWDKHREVTDDQIDRFNKVLDRIEAEPSFGRKAHEGFTADEMKAHGITEGEIASVGGYTGAGYKPINAVLRGKADKYYAGSELEWAKGVAKSQGGNVEKAVSKSPGLKEDHIVFRGMVMEKSFVDRLSAHQDSPGMIAFTDKGFVSTSTKESFASNWKNDNSHPGKKKVVFEILVPKENSVGRVLPVKHISQFKSEAEVIVQKGSTFKLLQTYSEGGATRVQAVLVDPAKEHWNLEVIKRAHAELAKAQGSDPGKFIVDAEDMEWFEFKEKTV